MEPKPREFIKCSSLKSGLLHARDGQCAISILVLPKLWRPRDKPRRHHVSWTGDHVSLIAYEGDRIAITLDTTELQKLRNLLRRACDEADRDARSRTEANSESSPADSESEAVESADGPSKAAPLIQRCMEFAIDPTASGLSDNSPHAFQSALRDYFKFLYLQRAPFHPTAADISDASWETIEDLWPFLDRAFVELLESSDLVFRHVYVHRKAPLHALRGRVDGASLAIALERGVGPVTCSYHELDDAAPIRQVLRTALGVVTNRPTARDLESIADDFADETASRAACLAAVLGGEDRMSIETALRCAPQIRLDRGSSSWQGALELAVCVFQSVIPFDFAVGDSLSPRPGICDGESAFVFSRETWRIWESIVRDAFENAGTRVETSPQTPWKGLGTGRRPDLPLREGKGQGVRLLVDVKYKDSPLPSIADQNQVFVYSYLYGCSHVVLAYPTTGFGFGRSGPWQRFSGGASLLAVNLPWPTREHCSTRQKWSGFHTVIRKEAESFFNECDSGLQA